jgi:hypothetical protein
MCILSFLKPSYPWIFLILSLFLGMLGVMCEKKHGKTWDSGVNKLRFESETLFVWESP